jgi:hypothetical protein
VAFDETVHARTYARDHGVMGIDTTFDFRTDAAGKDPDTYSPTLRRYHQLLWSKPLPGGVMFELVPTNRPPYYYSHTSEVGEFVLSTDAFIPAYTRYGVPKAILEQFSAAEHDHFNVIGYTMGGLILWPANPIDRKWTINQARGCLRRSIGDRMDLTLESIRRHYQAASSPLTDVLARYQDLFAAFEDFRGYVDLWQLRDMATDDYSAVRFFSRSTTSGCQRSLRTSTPIGSTGGAASSSSKHVTAGSTGWGSLRASGPARRA